MNVMYYAVLYLIIPQHHPSSIQQLLFRTRDFDIELGQTSLIRFTIVLSLLFARRHRYACHGGDGRDGEETEDHVVKLRI